MQLLIIIIIAIIIIIIIIRRRRIIIIIKSVMVYIYFITINLYPGSAKNSINMLICYQLFFSESKCPFCG